MCVSSIRLPASNSTANTPVSSGPQTIVTVNVKIHSSQKLHPFRVHKNYICHYSPYFEAAFNGNFVEGANQVLDLDDTKPKIFGMFLNWLYSQEVVDDEGNSPSCSDYINLWILADRLLVPTLQTHVLAQLGISRKANEKGKSLSSGIFQRVWDNTIEGSPLRAYLVEAMVKKPKPSGIKCPSHYPHGMLIAIIDGLRDREWNRMLREGAQNSQWFSDAELERFRVPEGLETRKTIPTHPEINTRNSSGPKNLQQRT